MGIRKFRSVAEMPGPAPRTPGDPENLRIACELSEVARRLSRIELRPGLRKLRSYPEPPDESGST